VLQEKKFISTEFDREWLKNVVKLYKARINTLADFVDWADFLFLDKPRFDQKAIEELLAKDLSREFKLLVDKLEKLSSFDIKSIEEAFRALVDELKITASDLVHPVRAALTGKTIGPGLFETIWVLGKEKTKQRLSSVYKDIKTGGQVAS
ncbi:MAG: hypothetical protein PHI86_05095, partial [Candidatus Omnitrophica bacterium]|nr:hypothetical protein [Candidatus Omnitrophota bacterium]